MSGSDTERDMLAAEFVLGTLDDTDRAEARRLIASDPAFAASVQAWEVRLNPLSRLAPSVQPPPDLWERIAAATAAPAVSLQAARARRALWRWRGATAASLALAAAFAGLAFLRAPPAPKMMMLAAESHGPLMLALGGQSGSLMVQPAAALSGPPTGRDYELWELPKGAAAPRAMGVLPPDGMRLTGSMAPGTKLMVSVEPKGGSPTGLPTGPVIYAGMLRAMPE